MKKTIIYIGGILAVIIFFAAGVEFFALRKPNINKGQNYRTPNSKTQVTVDTSDAKIVGPIQAIDNKQPVDGNLRVKINDTWIVIGGGLMPASSEPGVVTGFDFNNIDANIGKNAEVYAKKTGYDQSLTILDGSNYYFKITDSAQCVKAGESPAYTHPGDDMSLQCCAGLKHRIKKDQFDSSCVNLFEKNGGGGYVGICLSCGDGVCDPKFESKCNCPEDCK